MNRRQKKKRYKKIHGHNPISARKEYELLGAAIEAGIRAAFDNVKRAIEIRMENIKTMPEEEFKERLQNLSIEQQAIALKIRGDSVNNGKE